MIKKGIVYLVGAGPGDPGLLTRRGEACLRRSQVVVYDRLVSPQIVNLAPSEAELIYVGKASSQHTMQQEDINQLLADKASQGLTVVRLKGGDPYLFGRGGEEALYLCERGILFEVVPGVTSALAAPAYAGIPVTHRDYTSTLAIVTGHEQPDKKESSINWEQLTGSAGTMVFLMGVSNLAHITDQLIKAGKPDDTPIALIGWGTTARQRVLTGTLGTIVEQAELAEFRPPALIIIGQVVALRPYLSWFEARPLFGKRIVVTRSRQQASVLVEKLEELGAEVLEIPTIQIKKEPDLTPLHQELGRLTDYKWLVFTSTNAVAIFFEELWNAGYDARALAANRVAAIGPATAEALRTRGIISDLVPQEYRAEAVAEAMLSSLQPGDKVLLTRAKKARDVLPRRLEAAGAEVKEISIYEAVTAETPGEPLLSEITRGQIDAITFTSSSTVTNFVKMMENELDGIIDSCQIACIGPITAETAADLGLKPTVVADEYTIDGLVKSLITLWGRGGADL
ncbi:MAG: uroporphyrinogen-III C-methyltransferase [Methylocystaceae bacterium]